MQCNLLTCGIFQPELDRVLPEIRAEHPQLFADLDLVTRFVPSALHVDYVKLKKGVTDGLEECRPGNTALLYGYMCHPDLPQIAEEYGVPYLGVGNCIEIFLEPERKKELEKDGLIYYLTGGWLANWREIFGASMGWDTYDARQHLGRYEQLLVLDTGVYEYGDEDLWDLYEYTQVPVEVEPVALDRFKANIVDLCRKAFQKTS